MGGYKPKLDPEQTRIRAKSIRGVPDTTSILRATQRGTTLYMPLATPTQAQARAALKEIEAELEALRAEFAGGR